jgi:hypothetical protein
VLTKLPWLLYGYFARIVLERAQRGSKSRETQDEHGGAFTTALILLAEIEVSNC